MYTEKHKEKLWTFMTKQPTQGQIQVEIPAQKNKPARTAALDISFKSFTMNPQGTIFEKKYKSYQVSHCTPFMLSKKIHQKVRKHWSGYL